MHVCLPAPQDSVLAAKNPALFHTMRALVILLLQHAVRVRTRVHQGKIDTDDHGIVATSSLRLSSGVAVGKDLHPLPPTLA